MSNSEERGAVAEVLHGIERPVIVELGAHVGEEFVWLKTFNPSWYVMVEPDEENIARIERDAEPDLLIRAAVTAIDGLFPFHASTNHQAHNRASGSIRRPTGHLAYFPEVTFEETTVRGMALDSISEVSGWPEGALKRIDLLWVDIQGAERDMIAGGQKTLLRTRFMMIEAEPEHELYEGQALKPELLSLLPAWEVVKDFGYNLLLRNTRF